METIAKYKSVEVTKLPKYVAEAIVMLRRHNLEDIDILCDVYKAEYWNDVNIDGAINVLGEWLKMDESNYSLFTSAIVNGYEVEETKLDKFYKFYDPLPPSSKMIVNQALVMLEIDINKYFT